MGLFSKKEKIVINEIQTKKINSLLPKMLNKKIFEERDFFEYPTLADKLTTYTQKENLKKRISEKQQAIQKLELELATKITIYNTEVYNAKPLGMVDVGIVEKFTTTATGNRFENGVIGYAIEQALDNTWTKNNTQFNSIQKAKLELLKKSMAIYPKTNSIFKFEIDLRELGTSGNVFIYARGTASIKNDLDLKNENINLFNQISELKEDINLLKENNILYKENIKKIPRFKDALKVFLSKTN